MDGRTSVVRILFGGPRGFSSIFSSNFSPYSAEPVSKSYHCGTWPTAGDISDHVHECIRRKTPTRNVIINSYGYFHYSALATWRPGGCSTCANGQMVRKPERTAPIRRW